MLERRTDAWPRWAPAGAVLLGLAGSAAITLAAPRLVGHIPRWWFSPGLGAAGRPILYAGMAALVIAWLGLGRASSVGSVSSRQLGMIGGLWSIPLLVGAPLFSHDLFSYVAQGTIAHLGLSPYSHPPAVLARLGQADVLRAVSPFWRHTTSPYGPLFVWIASGVVGLTGSHLVLGAIVVRLINWLGLVVLAVYVPRLARLLGASPARAGWLVVVNPLLLLQLVAPGHNDLLMAGGMVLGIVLALEDRPLMGIAVCSLAGAIKLPALAAAGFVAIAWIRSLPGGDARVRGAAAAILTCAAPLALVSLLSGLGTGWISSSVFSTPNRVHLAITPATALGWTVGSVAGHTHALESAFGLVALGLVVAFGLERATRVDRQMMGRQLGVVLIAFALAGPAAWPWYFAWGLVLLAACPPGRLAFLLPIGSVVGAFLVKPDGILALPIQSSPAVLAVYVVGAALAWRRASARSERVVHAAA